MKEGSGINIDQGDGGNAVVVVVVAATRDDGIPTIDSEAASTMGCSSIAATAGAAETTSAIGGDERNDHDGMIPYRRHMIDVTLLTYPIVLSEIFQNTLPVVVSVLFIRKRAHTPWRMMDGLCIYISYHIAGWDASIFAFVRFRHFIPSWDLR